MVIKKLQNSIPNQRPLFLATIILIYNLMGNQHQTSNRKKKKERKEERHYLLQLVVILKKKRCIFIITHKKDFDDYEGFSVISVS